MAPGKRGKEFKILVEKDAKEKAIALSQRYGLPMKAVLSNLIDLCVDYDLLNPGFDKRLNAAMDKGEIQIRRDELASLKNKCAGLFEADGFFKCIQGREDKTPMIKKLAKDLSEALEGCAGCGETKIIRLENVELKKQVTTLESKLESGRVGFYPICEKGGEPNDDLTEMRCPEISLRYRPIKERKKKNDYQPCHAKGSKPYKRCQYIDWKQVIFKGEINKPSK